MARGRGDSLSTCEEKKMRGRFSNILLYSSREDHRNPNALKKRAALLYSRGTYTCVDLQTEKSWKARETTGVKRERECVCVRGDDLHYETLPVFLILYL